VSEAAPRQALAPRGLAASLGTIPRASRAQKPLPATPGKPGKPASYRPATFAPVRSTVSSVPRTPLAGRMPPLALSRGNPPRGGATRRPPDR
jgi:hypothetical protein